jgi:hypothetical protein
VCSSRGPIAWALLNIVHALNLRIWPDFSLSAQSKFGLALNLNTDFQKPYWSIRPTCLVSLASAVGGMTLTVSHLTPAQNRAKPRNLISRVLSHSSQKRLRDTIKIRSHTYCSRLRKTVLQHTYGGAGGVRRYSSYSFTTSALDVGEWSASRPGQALPPGEGPPVHIWQEAGWAPEPAWTQRLEEKAFSSAGDRTSIRSQTLHWQSYPGSHCSR